MLVIRKVADRGHSRGNYEWRYTENEHVRHDRGGV